MATATAAVGIAGGVAKFFEGRAIQKKAQGLIDNFEWRDRTNPYENQSVSTLGSDLRTEQNNVDTSTSVEALRGGGNRALVGGLGRVQAQSNTVNREIAVNLDEQQKRLDYAISGQDVRNQDVMEKRQSNELAGYGQLMNMGMGMKSQGLDGLVNGMGMFGSSNAGTQIDNKLWGVK